LIIRGAAQDLLELCQCLMVQVLIRQGHSQV
jgi:hypothetical protein